MIVWHEIETYDLNYCLLQIRLVLETLKTVKFERQTRVELKNLKYTCNFESLTQFLFGELLPSPETSCLSYRTKRN